MYWVYQKNSALASGRRPPVRPRMRWRQYVVAREKLWASVPLGCCPHNPALDKWWDNREGWMDGWKDGWMVLLVASG